jgi:deoxyribonuclease-4
MILGAHESTAGGLARVFERSRRDGAEAVQLWTRSSRQWAAKPLEATAIADFKHEYSRYAGGAAPLAAHASYLINLATANAEIYEKSAAALLDECQRAEQLGVRQVIFHPGAAQGCDAATGIAKTAAALRQICAALSSDGAKVRLLVEFTAGQGSSIGCSFAQLAEILAQADDPRLAVCLDTQHMYAAGVDWTTEAGYEQTFAEFDRLIGLSRLEAFHLNDSKKALGSRVDRHDVIGDGLIGLAPFARLLLDPRFQDVPGYLETPELPDGSDSFALCLGRLRSLLPA